MPYDLFISYSRNDDQKCRISQLIERIRVDFQQFAGRPLSDFFDKDDIKGMDYWKHNILQGLRESHLLLACLSPNYLQSEYCEWEFNEYLKSEVGRAYFSDGVAPVYFIEVPGWEDKDFARQCAAWVEELRTRHHFDLRPWFHAGEEALREISVKEQMDLLSSQIRERIKRSEQAAASLGNVENHNPHFTGRISELLRLRETLALGQVGVLTAVHGLGGVGKTALATEYAHVYAHEYGGGRWQVHCEGKDNLKAAILSLHGETGLAFEYTEPEKIDVDLQFKRMLRELKELTDTRAPHCCLLLLDNVDQPKLLEPAQTKDLPSAVWLHVLATTRLGEKELFGAHKDRTFLPVDELPEIDALKLIQSFQPGKTFARDAEREAALAIVRLLGGFTLAVESAAVFLGKFAEDGVTCGGFLARLQKEGLNGLDAAADSSEEGVRHGEMRLSATLLPTLERLGETEMVILRYASLLPADQVALPWLRSLAAEHFPKLSRDAEGDLGPWAGGLKRLYSLRILRKTAVVDDKNKVLVVRIHRMVQDIVRSRMIVEEQLFFQENIDRFVETRIADLAQASQWTQQRWELEPLAVLALLWGENNHPKAVWILGNVGHFLHRLADWSKAENLMQRALAISEQNYGKDCPDVATRLNNLGLLLQDSSNRTAETENLFRRALGIYERNGEYHSSVATVLNNLGLLLRKTQRFSESEPLLRRALDIYEQNCSEDNPGLARVLNNLGLLLQDTNRLLEAEPLFRRALDTYELCYGSNHPEVATVLNNLGLLLQATNRLLGAEPLLRRALDTYELCYGSNHPEVATVLNNLGLLLQATNRLTEAEPLLRRTLEITELNYGKDHLNVAVTLDNLGILLQATYRHFEAEPLFRRALEINEQSYGKYHPIVAIELNNLANLLQSTNRLSDAESLVRRGLEISEKNYGENHPDVARDLSNLGALLQATNRLAEAEPLVRRALLVLIRYKRESGFLHPHIQGVLNFYAYLLHESGSTDEEILTTLQRLAPDFTWSVENNA